MNYQDFLSVAIDAAIRGGRTVYKYWGDINCTDITCKSSSKDLVTIADKQAEKEILDTLKPAFPDHYIISEEGDVHEKDLHAEYTWAVDPLDGTTNFCHSYPFFCTSIGLLHNNEPVLGVVYNPVSDELFTAIKGQGAYLNGRKISVTETVKLQEALLVTGFAYTRTDEDHKQMASQQLFMKFNNYCHGVRRDGSAALDLCYVACGRLDGFWEYGLKVWDVVAGSVIVREAGGLVSDPSDLSHQSFDSFNAKLLATNGHLHDEIANEINKYVTKMEKLNV